MPPFWNPAALSYVVDWSAWATLIAGLAAVIGAYRIGVSQLTLARRQLKILDKQTDLLERQATIAASQTELENASLRAELYERRIAVLAAFEQYAAEVAMHDGSVANVERDAFFAAWAASRYMFGPEVYELGQQLLNVSFRLRQAAGRLARLGDDEREQQLDAMINAVTGNHDALNSTLAKLRDAMDAYLGLGAVRAAGANV